jgi:GT2 family glycosyltransferase
LKVGAINIDVSVIIVNWNTREMLAECLRSVAEPALSLSKGSKLKVEGHQSSIFNLQSSMEIIVVDNASSDGSAAMVRERFPSVQLIENATNVGFARANNQGLAQAAGRYAVLLNPDTAVEPGALETLAAFMDAHPRAGACGPRLLNADGTLQPSAHPMLTPCRELWRLLFLDRLLPRATYPMHRWDPATPRRVEVIKGACLVLRRAALDQVGLLDEDYFMYTEEVDLCHRLALAGWELWWEPRAAVVHYGEGSSKQAREEMYLQLYRSKVQFYRKFGGEPRAAVYKRGLRLVYWPRWLAATLGRPFNPTLTSQQRLFRLLLMELPGM